MATICLAIVNIVPIAMIIIGALNLQKCTVEPYIPIWLVVMGSVSLFKSALNCVYRAKRRWIDGEDESTSENQNVKPNPFDGLLSCFLLAWFIAGELKFVYGKNPENFPDLTKNRKSDFQERYGCIERPP